MLWLIQKMDNEKSFDELLSIMDRFNLNYQLVKALSFTEKIISPDIDLNGQDVEDIPSLEIDSNQNIFVCGSYSLAKIAKAKNWFPGAFINDNFNLESWKSGWGVDELLNGTALVSKIKDLNDIALNKFFARPLHDTKSFSGKVFSREEFLSWREKIIKTNADSLNQETEIVVAQLKKIYSETRLFVIDGKIVTGSLYKRGDKVIYDNLLNENLVEYAKEMIAKWQPDQAFVLDIAETSEGFKIIEVNNINSSGFYASDLFKFVDAIEGLDLKNNKNFTYHKIKI